MFESMRLYMATMNMLIMEGGSVTTNLPQYPAPLSVSSTNAITF